MRVFSISSQKGGTAKTTTAAALATGATHRGLRTLCIDLDPQGSLTTILRGRPEEGNSYQLLKGQRVKPQTETGVDTYIIPAALELAGLDAELGNTPGRDNRLRNALEAYKEEFDLVFIDTAPTLGTLLINALTASTDVIIPVQADMFASQSLYQLKGTIDQVRQYCNPELRVAGVLFTRYSARTTLARSMWEKTYNMAEEKLGYHCFRHPIREGVAAKEAQTLRVPLIRYSPKSNPCQDYEKALDEIIGGKDNGQEERI